MSHFTHFLVSFLIMLSMLSMYDTKISRFCHLKREIHRQRIVKLLSVVLTGLSSETPRVPPRIGWGIYHFGLPEG